MGADILWIEDLDDSKIGLAGAKIARLGELSRTGIVVPLGFAVTTQAYERFCAESAIDDAIATHLGRISDAESIEQLDSASTAIRGAVEAAPMSPDLSHEIVDAYEELSYRCLELHVPTAVRSSATGEDASDSSFAGQYDTYLGVTGGEKVLDAVRRCWGSLFTGRALHYRLEHGVSHLDSPMAVGVIELVQARASGVAFSIHPVTGKRDRMVIEGSWGWGEAVVQGLVTPDHFEIGKADMRVLSRETSHKTVVSAFDYEKGLVVETEMPARLQDESILDEEQIAAIVDAVLKIESHYGYPVDVEWVLDRHRRPGEPITIVQTRPETVHAADDTTGTPTWDPVKYAAKYAFGGRI